MGMIDKQWSKNDEKLYISLFIVLASGFVSIFAIHFISTRNKENVGIIATFNSFKQTRQFINNKNTSLPKELSHTVNVVNQNAASIKNDIRRLSAIQNQNFSSLRKVKVFNK